MKTLYPLLIKEYLCDYSIFPLNEPFPEEIPIDAILYGAKPYKELPYSFLRDVRYLGGTPVEIPDEKWDWIVRTWAEFMKMQQYLQNVFEDPTGERLDENE